MQNSEPTNAVQMSPEYVLYLSVLATLGLVVMWGMFWRAASRKNESITEILLNPSFFKTVAVMGVISGTVVLSLADRMPGNLTAAILSGIVGYVLGTTAKPKESSTTEKPKESPERSELTK